MLLKNGAEMNVADDKYGWTALMLATQHKYIPHSPSSIGMTFMFNFCSIPGGMRL